MSVPPSLSPTPGVPAVLRTSVSHPPTGPQTASATQQAPGPCLEAWAPVPGLQGLHRLTPRGPVRPPCSAGKPGWSGALCRVWFHGNRRGDTAQAAGSLAGGEQGKTFVRPCPSSPPAALRRLPLTPSAAHGVTQAYSSPPAAGRLVASGTPWCCHWRHGRCLASPHFPPGHVAVTSRVPGPPGLASHAELPGLGPACTDQRGRGRACAAFSGFSGWSFHSHFILCSGHRSLLVLDECPLGTEVLCLPTADSCPGTVRRGPGLGL